MDQLRKRVATLTAASDEPGLTLQEEVFAPAKRSRCGDLPGTVATAPGREGQRGFADGREPGKADRDT